MATMRKRTETERGHSYEYADMQPVAFRPDGTPVSFEIVQRDQAQHPRPIGHDDDVHIVSPVQPDRLPRVQHIVQSDAVGEARAFNIRVSSLAAVLGGGVVLAALMFGASLSFWSALMWFGSVFALTWAGAFALDAMRSPGGIELFHAMRMWAFLDREQAHRHNRYSVPVSDRVRLLQTVVGALAVGSTVLFVLLIVAAVALEWMPR